MRKIISPLFLFLLLTVIGSAQNKLLTIDDLYDPEKRVNFNGNPFTPPTWLDDQRYLQGGKKVNALTGQAEPFYDAAKMESALAKLPGMTADDAKRLSEGGFAMNKNRTAALINFANDLFYYSFGGDNRSASGKGLESTFTIYKNFGELELRDLEDGVAYLKTLPYVDGSRIGLNGWSFGGYMTAYAMTHSKVYKAGISGAPVTDWHLYDTIYTERYMGTPQNNPEGYEKSSVITAAKNLHGKLLLIHGAIDDNVHLQNSIQFIYELEKAGKQFDFMVYPKSRHGFSDPRLIKHLREMMLKFILENL